MKDEQHQKHPTPEEELRKARTHMHRKMLVEFGTTWEYAQSYVNKAEQKVYLPNDLNYKKKMQ